MNRPRGLRPPEEPSRGLPRLGCISVPVRRRFEPFVDHPARLHLLETVSREPGIILPVLVRRTGYARQSVVYHLRVLERAEAVAWVQRGRYRYYFVRNGRYVNRAKELVVTLRSPNTLALTVAVQRFPGLLLSELGNLVGRPPSALKRDLERLLRDGLVQGQAEARRVRYYPGSALATYDLSEFGLRRANVRSS